MNHDTILAVAHAIIICVGRDNIAAREQAIQMVNPAIREAVRAAIRDFLEETPTKKSRRTEWLDEIA